MAVPLTPDLCARAIIAAARTYGDDPVAALGPNPHRGAKTRRCLIPAALAIVQATGCSRPRLCQILGVDYYSLSAVPKKPLTAAPWRAALEALGVDPASIQRSRFGPKVKAGPTPDQVVVDNKKPAPTGTVVAPPVGQEAPAPTRVDHTAAIAEAMARRAAQARAQAAPTTCQWTARPGAAMDDATCDQTPVQGRLFCPEHCRALGQRDTPVVLARPQMPAPFSNRSLAHGEPKRAAL